MEISIYTLAQTLLMLGSTQELKPEPELWRSQPLNNLIGWLLCLWTTQALLLVQRGRGCLLTQIQEAHSQIEVFLIPKLFSFKHLFIFIYLFGCTGFQWRHVGFLVFVVACGSFLKLVNSENMKIPFCIYIQNILCVWET